MKYKVTNHTGVAKTITHKDEVVLIPPKSTKTLDFKPQVSDLFVEEIGTDDNEETPDLSWTKDDIQDWLEMKGVDVSIYKTKKEMMDEVKKIGGN